VRHSFTKYNLFLSQLDINQLMDSQESLLEAKQDNNNFLETSSKWAITWVAQRFSASLPHNQIISLSDLKTLI